MIKNILVSICIFFSINLMATERIIRGSEKADSKESACVKARFMAVYSYMNPTDEELKCRLPSKDNTQGCDCTQKNDNKWICKVNITVVPKGEAPSPLVDCE